MSKIVPIEFQVAHYTYMEYNHRVQVALSYPASNGSVASSRTCNGPIGTLNPAPVIPHNGSRVRRKSDSRRVYHRIYNILQYKYTGITLGLVSPSERRTYTVHRPPTQTPPGSQLPVSLYQLCGQPHITTISPPITQRDVSCNH
jgi:hypothetical protein